MAAPPPAQTPPAATSDWPADVRTLAVDVGGSGFKAAVLDAAGSMLTERARMDTPYPCPPATFVSAVRELVGTLTVGYHRVTVGIRGTDAGRPPPAVARRIRTVRRRVAARVAFHGPEYQRGPRPAQAKESMSRVIGNGPANPGGIHRHGPVSLPGIVGPPG